VLKRIKLTKVSWLILAAGIVIVALSSLGVTYFQQVSERDRLDEELSVAKLRLNSLQLQEIRSRKQELEQQLSETISELEAAKADLSQPVESITATDTLFATSYDTGVVVNKYGSSDFTQNNLEGIMCSVLPVAATVEGDVPYIIDFIIRLNGNFMTGFVKSIDIRVSDNTTTQDDTLADIQQVIYIYRGD